MLSESHPLIRQILRFIALPYCYIKLVNWEECSLSKLQVVKDFIFIFFKLKYYPDNYSPCRLWEKDRKLWSYYYGSSYHPYQRAKLRKDVQKFEYIKVFDDKEVCELLSRGMDINLPVYHGALSPDADYRKLLLKLLKIEAQVIIKPINGQAGKGIVLAYKKGPEYKVRIGHAEKDLSDFILTDRAIVQQVVVQENTIAKFSPFSVNTIRVVTLYTKANEAIIISASMRFGVGEAYVDNWSAGGVAVGVDHKNGTLKKIAYDKKGTQYLIHPVSKMPFDGFEIPQWDKVVELAERVQEKCSFFKMLGLDIAVTDDGPVLIEINPNPDLIFQEQTAGPLLADDEILQEFDKYDLLFSKYQKKLLN
jgi:hypothetical protein